MPTFVVYLDTGFSVKAETKEEAIAPAKEILKTALEEDSGELEFHIDEEWDDDE